MLLEKFPTLQQLDAKEMTELAMELLDRALDDAVELPPELLAAIEECVADNDARPHEVFTSAEVEARLAGLKRKIAARRAHA